MKITTYTTPSHISEQSVKDSCVVIIDVLRATSTIICSLIKNADKVIPTRDVNEAVKVSKQIGSDGAILAGEAKGVKLPDFDIDNSPAEFMIRDFRNKTIVLKTSNGTDALNKFRNCPNVFAGAMLNKDALAKVLYNIGKDVVFVCAGTDGKLSVDDMYCAGAVITALKSYAPNAALGDSSLLCEFLYQGGFDLVKRSSHFIHLQKLGKTSDLELCFTENITDIVPVYQDGIINKYSS